MSKTIDETIFYEAFKITAGERVDMYGAPEDSFQIIASFWSIYLKYVGKIDIDRQPPLTAIDVAHMMSLLKHARMMGQKPSRDNYIDAIGYLAICADRLMK